MQLRVEDAQWLLPPGRAAWIPARCRHRVESGPLALRTVYLHPTRLRGAPREAVVFGASALAREMILEAMRWGPSDAGDRVARALFGALAALVPRWAEGGEPFRLPVARSPELRRAMQWTLRNLGGSPRVEHAARAGGMSARSLARRFAEETGTTWRRFLHDARMLEAMQRLAEPGARVGDVADALGFRSAAAFCHAFKAFVGQSPQRYATGRASDPSDASR